MASFVFTKANPSDPRDIGLEIEEASRALAESYDGCAVEVVDYSRDDDASVWVRVELRSEGSDCDEAGNWYFGELRQRGIVIMQANQPLAQVAR
jgi:hypothetical protein